MEKQLFTWEKVFFQNKDSSKQCSSLIHQVVFSDTSCSKYNRMWNNEFTGKLGWGQAH